MQKEQKSGGVVFGFGFFFLILFVFLSPILSSRKPREAKAGWKNSPRHLQPTSLQAPHQLLPYFSRHFSHSSPAAHSVAGVGWEHHPLPVPAAAVGPHSLCWGLPPPEPPARITSHPPRHASSAEEGAGSNAALI